MKHFIITAKFVEPVQPMDDEDRRYLTDWLTKKLNRAFQNTLEVESVSFGEVDE